MFFPTTPRTTAKAPLRSPLRAPRRPSEARPSDTPDPTDPRYPCQGCGKRPSETIVGFQLDAGARWLCRFCWGRGKV